MKKKSLGEVLKSQREIFGLTQRELALKLGVRASHVAYLEKGRRRPSLGLVSRIADVLGRAKEPLFLLAHPEASSLLSERREEPAAACNPDQVWRDFTGNKALLARHQVKPTELRVLSLENQLGNAAAPRR